MTGLFTPLTPAPWLLCRQAEWMAYDRIGVQIAGARCGATGNRGRTRSPGAITPVQVWLGSWWVLGFIACFWSSVTWLGRLAALPGADGSAGDGGRAGVHRCRDDRRGGNPWPAVVLPRGWVRG